MKIELNLIKRKPDEEPKINIYDAGNTSEFRIAIIESSVIEDYNINQLAKIENKLINLVKPVIENKGKIVIHDIINPEAMTTGLYIYLASILFKAGVTNLFVNYDTNDIPKDEVTGDVFVYGMY